MKGNRQPITQTAMVMAKLLDNTAYKPVTNASVIDTSAIQVKPMAKGSVSISDSVLLLQNDQNIMAAAAMAEVMAMVSVITNAWKLDL